MLKQIKRLLFTGILCFVFGFSVTTMILETNNVDQINQQLSTIDLVPYNDHYHDPTKGMLTLYRISVDHDKNLIYAHSYLGAKPANFTADGEAARLLSLSICSHLTPMSNLYPDDINKITFKYVFTDQVINATVTLNQCKGK